MMMMMVLADDSDDNFSWYDDNFVMLILRWADKDDEKHKVKVKS